MKNLLAALVIVIIPLAFISFGIWSTYSCWNSDMSVLAKIHRCL